MLWTQGLLLCVAPGQDSLSGHEGPGSLGGLAWTKALVHNDGSGCDFVSECSLLFPGIPGNVEVRKVPDSMFWRPCECVCGMVFNFTLKFVEDFL